MRIAHATDIHWMCPPSLHQLVGKRFLGALNLYLANRRHHFSPAVQTALVDAVLASEPDLVLITGDLTALALPEEFELARRALQPLLDRVPTLVLPGNHDVYSSEAVRAHYLADQFGPWMHLTPDGLARLSLGDTQVIGLDPNRPHLTASGVLPDAQLRALPAALAEVPPEQFLVLALHYPVLDRRGEVYDGGWHGLRNARALISLLEASPRRPDLIVHGHLHHGFRATLSLGGGAVPILNPGAGGYAWLPEQDRAACFNVYEVRAGELASVQRHRFGPDGFAPEHGGAYASGR
jgi:3',5'-cyclic AMP phosphodiesterase CpdA